MFKPTWRKYLPVITILLKRSAGSEQLLNMNHTDFERASGGRKTKYSFNHLQLNSGRINSDVKHNPIAKELAELLQEDLVTNRILVRQRFEFEMNNEFQLIIRNNTPAPEVLTENTANVAELVETTGEVNETE